MSKIKDSTWFTEMGSHIPIGIVATEDEITGETKLYIGTGVCPGPGYGETQKLDEEKIASTGAKLNPEHIAKFCEFHSGKTTPVLPKKKEEARLYRSVINRLNNPERSNARDAAILKDAMVEALTEHEMMKPPPIVEYATQMQSFVTTLSTQSNMGCSGIYNDSLNLALAAISNSGGEVISVQVMDPVTNMDITREAIIHYKAPIGSNIYI